MLFYNNKIEVKSYITPTTMILKISKQKIIGIIKKTIHTLDCHYQNLSAVTLEKVNNQRAHK